MKVIDPGHRYEVDGYDGGKPQIIDFMKRIGEGYPGNTGKPRGGTNLQELFRIAIDRTKYLDNQIHHKNNFAIIRKAGECLWLLEDRAAERHGFRSEDIDFRPDNVEQESHCLICGHILCRGH